mmetsp:Transcript_7414/g.23273  ORF Transcript_7414/g.23273 Transcript_7414/m.23273 type:complete len:266 (+) Transcript_7414:683-1480(+)
MGGGCCGPWNCWSCLHCRLLRHRRLRWCHWHCHRLLLAVDALAPLPLLVAHKCAAPCHHLVDVDVVPAGVSLLGNWCCAVAHGDAAGLRRLGAEARSDLSLLREELLLLACEDPDLLAQGLAHLLAHFWRDVVGKPRGGHDVVEITRTQAPLLHLPQCLCQPFEALLRLEHEDRLSVNGHQVLAVRTHHLVVPPPANHLCRQPLVHRVGIPGILPVVGDVPRHRAATLQPATSPSAGGCGAAVLGVLAFWPTAVPCRLRTAARRS